MLCNIWVKDTFDGRVHQVGTEPHDSLIFLKGAIHYYNIQNGDGTFLGEYEFVESPNIDDYIEVTPDILRINRELIRKDLLKELEDADIDF